MHIFESFKRFREDRQDLERIQELGICQLRDIQEQLQKLMNWWPEMDIFTPEHGTNALS